MILIFCLVLVMMLMVPLLAASLLFLLKLMIRGIMGWRLCNNDLLLLRGVIGEFAKKNLGDFALATGMKHVVVLSSLEFMRLQKIDASSGLQIYDVSCTNTDGTDDSWEWLGWKKWLEYNPAQRTRICTLAEGNSM
ncbi:uncharacterized protein LOC112328657 isoform X1 [Populus trichocarpa]|uniref:Uncharacterized protein n=1 Tax=Populus trichocarpa TaxID=3694 RepID=A0A3N7FL79_POPTR|nr:uncharacterized protein LOC112328657 isoform X1 [Populus trichocarpa]XP_052311684.1 uncharacterized protein LOC112328657 isoform X1 [Populus trichocarpa]